MAGFNVSVELRPCLVNGKKHLFHKWMEKRWLVGASSLRGGHPGGLCAMTMALVEDEHGQMHEVHPQEVRFLDGLIKEYSFVENESECDGQSRLEQFEKEGADNG